MPLSHYIRYFFSYFRLLLAHMCFPPLFRFLPSNGPGEALGCPARDELVFQLPLRQVSHLCLA